VVLCKDVDIHADGATFGDDGRTAIGHQWVTYKVCAVNTGSTTLTNVVIDDPVAGDSLVVKLDPGLTQIGGTRLLSFDTFLAGGVVRSSPISLGSGASRCYAFVAELRAASGSVVSNAATLTADGGTTATSNTVRNPMGKVPGQPGIISTGASKAIDATTKVITYKLQLTNVGAGTASGTIIDQVLLTDPSVSLLTPLPISAGTIAPGATSPVLTIQVKVPATSTTFNIVARAVAIGADGLPYAFGLPFSGN
jgi:uncharacterized repeat protein (TIGR01451 family)